MRDAKGRFAVGNTFAAEGGRARAKTLSRRRRKAIARKGYRAMVKKHFLGDYPAQKKYFAALGRWNYEQMATVTGGLGLSVKLATRHPGKPTDFLARYWQLDLLRGEHNDVQFMRGPQ